MGLLENQGLNSSVIKTIQTRKLTIDGITTVYPVYKIKLDLLYYNNQNDRIATWISKYKSEHNGSIPSLDNKEEYNSIIESFIVESNPDAINKTQNNIELVDQREAGVVLNDGLIIDGNRRFTCLRRLAKKNPKFGYFEAVILDRNISTNAKEIKMLELSIQHGEESRVDYNPIDKLVGIYNDIVDTKLISIEEYATSTNTSIKEVEHRVEVACLMVEFLDFINAPKQFHIARDLSVAATLEGIPVMLSKCKSKDEKEDLKNIVFTNILMHPPGEMRDCQRNISKIISSEYKEDFIIQQKEISEQILDSLPEEGKVNTQTIRSVIRNNESMVDELENSIDLTLNKVRRKQNRSEPLRLVDKANSELENIDQNIILKMNDDELELLSKSLEKIKETISLLERNMK